MILRNCLIYIIFLMLSGCVAVSLHSEAQSVRIVFNNDDLSKCEFIAEVTGSRGNWYSYLFMPNDNMIRDALIDLRNNTSNAGGNTVKLSDQQIGFTTSVTFWGQAFQCNRPDKKALL